MNYSRVEKEREKKRRYSLRTLSGVGVVSAVVGLGLVGKSASVVEAATGKATIHYQYVTTDELSEQEKTTILRSLPKEVSEDASYYLVYRPVSAKAGASLPHTGDDLLPLASLVGGGLLVVAVSLRKKRLVKSMVALSIVGGAVAVTLVLALQVKLLASYNHSEIVTIGSEFPTGQIAIQGYEFVGYIPAQMGQASTSSSASDNKGATPVQPEMPKSDKAVAPAIPEAPKADDNTNVTPVEPTKPVAPEAPKADDNATVTPVVPEAPKADDNANVTPVEPTKPVTPEAPKADDNADVTPVEPTKPVTPEQPKSDDANVTPVTPVVPETPKSELEAAQAAAETAKAEEATAQQAVEAAKAALVEAQNLSTTQRPSQELLNKQRGFAVVIRDFDIVVRNANEKIAALQSQLAATTDEATRASLSEQISAAQYSILEAQSNIATYQAQFDAITAQIKAQSQPIDNSAKIAEAQAAVDAATTALTNATAKRQLADAHLANVQQKIADEEAARKQAEADAAAAKQKAEAEEAARKQAEADAEAKKKAEDAAATKKKAEEDAAQKTAEEDEAAKLARVVKDVETRAPQIMSQILIAYRKERGVVNDKAVYAPELQAIADIRATQLGEQFSHFYNKRFWNSQAKSTNISKEIRYELSFGLTVENIVDLGRANSANSAEEVAEVAMNRWELSPAHDAILKDSRIRHYAFSIKNVDGNYYGVFVASGVSDFE